MADLGVGGLWLTPFYPSPKVDQGYDIRDYQDVDPSYGTLEVFRDLVALAHQRGIRIVVDMVLNHTSDQHPWFVEARKSTESRYRDYYLWTAKPNN